MTPHVTCICLTADRQDGVAWEKDFGWQQARHKGDSKENQMDKHDEMLAAEMDNRPIHTPESTTGESPYFDWGYVPPAPACILARDIYKNGISVPDGYEVISFRIPHETDFFLSIDGKKILQGYDGFDCRTNPRLILKKLTTHVIKLTELRRGLVNQGEYYSFPKQGWFSEYLETKPYKDKTITAYKREDIEE